MNTPTTALVVVGGEDNVSVGAVVLRVSVAPGGRGLEGFSRIQATDEAVSVHVK